MDSTAAFLSHLPPLKRHRFIQQQQNQQNTPSPLPAKKRKESRNSSNSPSDDAVPRSPSVYPLPTKKRVFALQLHHDHPNDAVSPPESHPVYSLPAKKRIRALQPQFQNDAVSSFDLNVEYKPSPNPKSPTAEKPQSEPEPENPQFEPEPEKSQPEPRSESEQYQNQQEQAIADDDDDEDGILCCVCQSTDGDAEDPIVFCDGCDLMVHASCYGNPLSNGIPDGDWFCERCRFEEKDGECRLCPVKEGAMKRTTEGGWAHVACALIVPEVFFADPEGRDGIDCSKVPRKRWSERCYVCGCGGGCAVVCSEPKCRLAFHATCALKEQLSIEYKEDRKGATIVAGFCKTHSLLWEKQQLSGKYKIVAIEDKKQ